MKRTSTAIAAITATILILASCIIDAMPGEGYGYYLEEGISEEYFGEYIPEVEMEGESLNAYDINGILIASYIAMEGKAIIEGKPCSIAYEEGVRITISSDGYNELIYAYGKGMEKE